VDSVLVTDKPEAMMNCRIACEVGFSVSCQSCALKSWLAS
jgi:hypothetical protein